METINNAAGTIKNSIWGDGTTNVGSTEYHKSMIDDSVTETKFNGRVERDPEAEGSYQPDQGDTDRRPQGPTSTGGQPQGANVTGDQGTNNNPFSSSNEPNSGFGGKGAQPSVTADPSSGQQSTPKHQGADRPNSEPDQPTTGSGESSASAGSAQSGRMGDGGMKLPDSDNKSSGEGTGTLYEKSTGLQCDGGDFDATRPGAAREAARLMDEKGLKHNEAKPKGETEDDSKGKKWYGVDHSGFGGHGSHQNQNKRGSVSSTASGKDENRPTENERRDYNETNDYPEKKGLGQKIKDKLHSSSN